MKSLEKATADYEKAKEKMEASKARYMFQVNEVEGSVLSWCASRESNMLEIDPTELFRGLQ